MFTPHDTAATAAALMFYAPGLLGYSAVKIASPSFYSLGDSRTPATVSVLSIARQSRAQHHAGRGHGVSAGWRSARRSPRSSTPARCCSSWAGGSTVSTGGASPIAFGKILVASILMGAASYFAAQWLADVLPSPRVVLEGRRASPARSAPACSCSMGSARLLAIAEFNDARGQRHSPSGPPLTCRASTCTRPSC